MYNDYTINDFSSAIVLAIMVHIIHISTCSSYILLVQINRVNIQSLLKKRINYYCNNCTT